MASIVLMKIIHCIIFYLWPLSFSPSLRPSIWNLVIVNIIIINIIICVRSNRMKTRIIFFNLIVCCRCLSETETEHPSPKRWVSLVLKTAHARLDSTRARPTIELGRRNFVDARYARSVCACTTVLYMLEDVCFYHIVVWLRFACLCAAPSKFWELRPASRRHTTRNTHMRTHMSTRMSTHMSTHAEHT